jgi:acyl-CoA dehydrogenase
LTRALDALVARARRAGVRAGELGLPELERRDESAAAHAALSIVRDAGLTAWTVPKRCGGADAGQLVARGDVSVRALCAIRGELARHSGLLDVMFVMQGLGSYPLAIGAKPKLRAALLPEVARGARIAAFALTEPGAGSSLSDIATTARKSKHGWKLNGHKTFISNAGIASFYTVLARTSGAAGDAAESSLSMFFVPASSRGLEISRFEVTAPHPIGDLHFHDVDVPKEHLIGKPGRGLSIALATLARFRTSVAAAANGFARRALDESCGHLSRRKQFGKPLASFQSLRFDVAEMDTRLRAAELLVAEAAEAVDAGRDATKEVARAKLFATENASWICDRAIQHFGGSGVKRGSTVERLWREARALRIYEGTSEIQKLVLAKALLD